MKKKDKKTINNVLREDPEYIAAMLGWNKRKKSFKKFKADLNSPEFKSAVQNAILTEKIKSQIESENEWVKDINVCLRPFHKRAIKSYDLREEE